MNLFNTTLNDIPISTTLNNSKMVQDRAILTMAD